VSLTVHLLDGRVVGVLMRDKEGGLDRTSIGVVATILEDLLVDINVVVIDSVIKRDSDHLGYTAGLELTGDLGTIVRAETIRKNTL